MVELDEARAERFSERLAAMLNGGAVTLALSIGNQLGLFDALASNPGSTSLEIAERTSLNERYLREWLAVLVVDGIVEYDPEGGHYSLPPEHAASLCDAGDGFNLAQLSPFIPMLARIEHQIVDCFRAGGGVPYSEYPGFQKLMAEYSEQMHRDTLVTVTLPKVGVTTRLEEGMDVLDVGCGSGVAVQVMAEAFPRSRFTGLDFSDEAVQRANHECQEKGLDNARFISGDAAKIEERAAYDFITSFDAIHDQAFPRAVLAGIHTALRPNGTYLMVEPHASSKLENNGGELFSAFSYVTSLMHCMPVSLAYGGEGLGAMWGEELAREYLVAAGFAATRVFRPEHDFDNDYFVSGK